MSNPPRTYAEDVWCIQKHLLLAGVHIAEVLQKLYREAPNHPGIEVLEQKYQSLVTLRTKMFGKWGSLAKQEQFDCVRCQEDLCPIDAGPNQNIVQAPTNSTPRFEVIQGGNNKTMAPSLEEERPEEVVSFIPYGKTG